MARLTSELVLSLTDKVSGPARKAGGALDLLSSKTKRASGMGMEVAAYSGLSSAATAAAAMAAGGAALGGAAVVKSAADFESALTEIQKKAGTTAAETAKIGEEIKALATSGELAVPIEEIAAAYERGAAAGIPIGELRQFAMLSAKAADAFGMSAEEVGNFTSKLKVGLGMTNDQVRQVLDLTNSLADAGIADESSIVDYMDRVGASLKTLGVSAPNSLALGATMLNLGMSSEVAATGTDALVQKLLTVSTITGKKRKTFERYMGSVEDFAGMIKDDANGALLTMLDRLKSLDSTKRMEFLSEFMGAEHAGKVLRVVEAIEELRRNLALAADESKWFGSLNASYKLKLDDFWSQWTLVKNALEKLAIDTGTMGMPAFKAALDGALVIIADVGNGLKTFRAEVDVSEVRRALDAVSELGGKVGEIMGMGGGEGTPIMQFFKRLADTANVVSSGMNIARDVLESVGLATPDADTSRDRQKRRDGWLDSYEDVNPFVGPMVRSYRDWANRDAPEQNGRADETRDRSLDDFLGGSGLPSAPQPAAPADRGGRVMQPSPDRFGLAPESASSADANARLAVRIETLAAAMRERAVDLGRTAGIVPVPVLRPTPGQFAQGASNAVTIPTPRPNIEGPVREESERAASAAEAAG